MMRAWCVIATVICLSLIASLAYVAEVEREQLQTIADQETTIQRQQERIEKLSSITMGNITITIEPKIEPEGRVD